MDDYTLPPVLDMARTNGAKNERPTEVFDMWLAKEFPKNLMYPTHGPLDESHDFFRGKHLVVMETDIDRYLATSMNFMVGNKLSGKKETLKDRWQRENYNDFTYGLKSFKTYAEELLENTDSVSNLTGVGGSQVQEGRGGTDSLLIFYEATNRGDTSDAVIIRYQEGSGTPEPDFSGELRVLAIFEDINIGSFDNANII